MGMQADAQRAHHRMLVEEMEQFMADWRRHAVDGWVPMRLVRITSLVSWELRKAGLIEVAGGEGRPL